MNLGLWQRIAENLSEKRSTSETDILIGFLKKELFRTPDHYSGVTLNYYYSVSDHKFYTRENHWDGGNMFGNRTGERITLTREQKQDVLEERKRIALREIGDIDKEAFDKIYVSIERMLLGWIE